MSERKKPPSTGLRRYWQGVSTAAAVRWEEETYPTGATITTGPTAVVFYGDVSWRALQDLELAKMTPVRAGFPEWDQDDPPQEDDLARRWSSPANERKREEVRRMVEDPDFRATYRATFEHRQTEESAGDFYARVADYYRMRTALTGRPTQDLAVAAGVPKTTAARWVREARIRGYLAPTKKGRTSS